MRECTECWVKIGYHTQSVPVIHYMSCSKPDALIWDKIVCENPRAQRIRDANRTVTDTAVLFTVISLKLIQQENRPFWPISHSSPIRSTRPTPVTCLALDHLRRHTTIANTLIQLSSPCETDRDAARRIYTPFDHPRTPTSTFTPTPGASHHLVCLHSIADVLYYPFHSLRRRVMGSSALYMA